MTGREKDGTDMAGAGHEEFGGEGLLVVYCGLRSSGTGIPRTAQSAFVARLSQLVSLFWSRMEPEGEGEAVYPMQPHSVAQVLLLSAKNSSLVRE